jgi:hypothetical protein
MLDCRDTDRNIHCLLCRVLDCNLDQHEWEGEWPWCIHCHKDKQFLEMIEEIVSLKGARTVVHV